jgi:hypothetical protein
MSPIKVVAAWGLDKTRPTLSDFSDDSRVVLAYNKGCALT